MIANLRCAAGHRHYSPEPDEWAGKECNYGGYMTTRGSSRVGRCSLPIEHVPPTVPQLAAPQSPSINTR